MQHPSDGCEKPVPEQCRNCRKKPAMPHLAATVTGSARATRRKRTRGRQQRQAIRTQNGRGFHTRNATRNGYAVRAEGRRAAPPLATVSFDARTHQRRHKSHDKPEPPGTAESATAAGSVPAASLAGTPGAPLPPQAPNSPSPQPPYQPQAPQAPGQPYPQQQAPGQPYPQAPGQPYAQAPGQPLSIWRAADGPCRQQAPRVGDCPLLILGIMKVAPAGIITGHMALSKIKRTGEGGRGLALAGTIIGYVGTALGLLAIAITVVTT